MVKAVVGSCWGDEGKGKITDFLANDADIVVRYQGGNNAGHTIRNQYGKFALHLLPSGSFHQDVLNVIANGVAVNVPSLIKEINELTSRGVPAPNLMISDRAQILLSAHVKMDVYEEERLGKAQFGSTRSGIAPFYSDKYLKIGFQVCELFDDEILKRKVKNYCVLRNALFVGLYGKEPLLEDELMEELHSARDQIAPFVGDTMKVLQDAIKDGKNVLLEGQLGALRDPDFGIYPYTTSSHTTAGFGAVGAGIPPYAITDIIAVVKAYSSAVGAGAFVSELFGDEADEMRNRGGDGGEYGATTGRPRRVGWFDAVAARYGCQVQGATEAVVTVVDALGYLDEISICVGYAVDGQVIQHFPATPTLNRCKPIYKHFRGWKSDIRGIRQYSELPDACREYVEAIEAELGIPVTMVSNGPNREDIIFRK